VHNAINPAVMDGVCGHLDELRTDPDLRAVFLRSTGPTFCAGGDLKHMRSTAHFSFEENEQDAMRLSAVFDTINYFPRYGLHASPI
jgi:methylglutaconyl-CoA hydratase